MRSPASNPFLPGSDAVPPVWAGRAHELADFHDVLVARRSAGIYERGRLILGEPGIGKSVLANRIAHEAEEAGHWVIPTVRLAAGDDPLARLLAALRTTLEQRIAELTTSLTDLLDRVREITLPIVGGGVQLAPPAAELAHTTVTDVLVQLAQGAAATGRLLLVRLDEVQHLEGAGLSQLLTVLGDGLNAEGRRTDASGTVHVRKLPLAVYLSGLPEFYPRATAAGATFARRFKPLELGPLQEEDMVLALRPFVEGGWPVLTDDGPRPIRMEPAAAEALVEASHGSPFIFQLVGEAAWNAGAGEVITAAEAERGIATTGRETRTHFRLRLAPLTELQRRFLVAAARLDDHERTLGRVAEALGSPSGRLGSTARLLDERYRLVRRRGGKLTFRSPGLLEHLRRDTEG